MSIGVLEGRAPDLRDFLDTLGVPGVDTAYFNNCFQDGAVLLIIRTRTAFDERSALDVILRHGGILPRAVNFGATRSSDSQQFKLEQPRKEDLS